MTNRLPISKISRYFEGDHVDYYQVREEKDPFLDSSGLDPLELEQAKDVKSGNKNF